jgi:uncharacterized protein (DUF1015 family)
MPDVRPFRAVRYAQLTPSLVAPPYDVIGPPERLRLLAADPHNVAHLTLHESEQKAGALFRHWLDEGVLVREDEPAVWALTQQYIGPDGVARIRGGVAASLRAEPYETGAVLPHERTHSGPKESRLRLLRAAHAQLEPIFLLYDGEQPLAAPAREPDLAADGTQLWRLGGDALGPFFSDRQLLIADGHHRYETALAYHAEQQTPASARVLVVLVSTADPGLEIFPTHRVFDGRDDIEVAGERLPTVEEGLARLGAMSHDLAAAVVYRSGQTRLVVGREGELDVELVDRFGLAGIDYTPDWHQAVDRVDRGDADVAFLLRPTRIEDVFDRARRGEVLPPKTTYFYPKLVSGLLFHPLEEA